jgi:hypothetical protein
MLSKKLFRWMHKIALFAIVFASLAPSISHAFAAQNGQYNLLQNSFSQNAAKKYRHAFGSLSILRRRRGSGNIACQQFKHHRAVNRKSAKSRRIRHASICFKHLQNPAKPSPAWSLSLFIKRMLLQIQRRVFFARVFRAH